LRRESCIVREEPQVRTFGSGARPSGRWREASVRGKRPERLSRLNPGRGQCNDSPAKRRPGNRFGMARHSGLKCGGRTCWQRWSLPGGRAVAFASIGPMQIGELTLPTIRISGTSDVRVWNSLQTTYVRAGVSYSVEQFPRCDPLRLIL
jgi:hypothetical protein